MTNGKCSICDELVASSSSRFAATVNAGGVMNAVFYETKNLVVLPSIGPLAKGHCLVVTKKHVNSVLLSALSGDFFPELEECIESVVRCYGACKSILIGEHGSKSCQTSVSLCSTEHAHLHVVPVGVNEASPIVNTFDGATVTKNIVGLAMHLQRYEDYVFVSNYQHAKSVLSARVVSGDKIYSQMLRKHIGEMIGNEKWALIIPRSKTNNFSR
ncbi:HIT family protein [Rhabdochromatium marinum]|uniref:HIT family protein n=1 Tax=Rhabdochromatium marinum TaxID=48729 RepID=UPI0019048E64|nr:HIT domain-containing protein [Rhabdochromatium marinum]MBK1650547.1 hypothetical protein [Rhabdochromatium marinum]